MQVTLAEIRIRDRKQRTGHRTGIKIWIDEIRTYAGVTWQRDAKDRYHWKRLGEAYAER